MPLNAQEIRQALNQQGKGVRFLIECAESDIFTNIVSVPAKRMLDRELVLRFMSFKLSPNATHEFPFNNMGEFLDEAMEKLDNIKDDEKLNELKNSLFETLEFSEKILGEKHRFSRSIAKIEKTNTLNRSLFDVLTVCFSEIKDKKAFVSKKDEFRNKLSELLKDESSDFSRAITEGTSGKGAIEKRFEIMKKIIEEILNEN